MIIDPRFQNSFFNHFWRPGLHTAIICMTCVMERRRMGERITSWIDRVTNSEIVNLFLMEQEMDFLRIREKVNSCINWVIDFFENIDPELRNILSGLTQHVNSSMDLQICLFHLAIDPELKYRRYANRVHQRLLDPNMIENTNVQLYGITNQLPNSTHNHNCTEYKRRWRINFRNTFNDFFRKIDENKCRDFLFISKVFQLALMFSSNYFSYHYLLNKYRVGIPSNSIRQLRMNFVARLMIFPYKSDISLDVLPYDAIHWAVLNGEYFLLEILLKYGVMYFALNDHEITWMECCSRIRWLTSRNEKQLLLPKSVMLSNFLSLSGESRQRMLAVYKAVEVLFCRVPLYSPPDEIICFRTAFETIPEPFITIQEIKVFLKYCFSVSSDDDFLQREICHYKYFFPESTQPRTPRSLMHLSRCQVRQNLRQVRQFPHGIEDLNISDSIKMYIVHANSKIQSRNS